MSTAIKIENLSKQYRLGEVGTGSLGHDINRWWHRVRGLENPYLRIGEESKRSKRTSNEYVWALSEINLEVKQGEVLGIIGLNGAGKSTLLKILSRTTAPTIGSVKIKGKVASLLEVGTGFHPDLTGRDNVYLNGTLMGMRKAEVTKKLEEIIDFAGVERYIDTPVKRYSSGMYVRLAFAVAAHLEPDVLIVDEVLAVGDAEFQKKCLGKMGDISSSGGRTVLFVSHNLKAIQNLCQSAVFLKAGKLIKFGEVNSVVDAFMNESQNESSNNWQGRLFSMDSKMYLSQLRAQQVDTSAGDRLSIYNNLTIEAVFNFEEDLDGIAFELFVTDLFQVLAFSYYTPVQKVQKGIQSVQFTIPKNQLNDITYNVTIGVSRNYLEFILKANDLVSINMWEPEKGEGFQGAQPGAMRPEIGWSITKLK